MSSRRTELDGLRILERFKAIPRSNVVDLTWRYDHFAAVLADEAKLAADDVAPLGGTAPAESPG